MAREVLPITACILDPFLTVEQGKAQWWENSPPTNCVRIQIAASTPYVGWVCCWFSPLLREIFLRVVRFPPLFKNQHFQIPILYSTHEHVFSYRTPKCFEGKQIVIYQNIFPDDMIIIEVSIYADGLDGWICEKICYCYYKYYFSSIIHKIPLRTKLVTSAALVTAHPPLPHPTKIFIVPAWDVSLQRQYQQ